MRLLAVSSPVDVEVDGKQPPTIKEEGDRPRADQLARARRAARASPTASASAITGWVEAGARHRRSGRRTSSATTGRRSSRRAPSSTTSWPPSRSACRPWSTASGSASGDRRAASFGGVLLAAGVIALIATLRRRRRLGGERAAARSRGLLGAADRARPRRSCCWPGEDLEPAHRGGVARDALADARRCWSALLIAYALLARARSATRWRRRSSSGSPRWLLGSDDPVRDVVVGRGARRRDRPTRSRTGSTCSCPTGPWGV